MNVTVTTKSREEEVKEVAFAVNALLGLDAVGTV